MILQKIFRQALVTPQKLALAYRGHRISYGEFAYWIALARDFLASQDLRPGSLAALASVPEVHLQYVDSIPRNEMGKIDRPAIRQKISAMLPGRTAA